MLQMKGLVVMELPLDAPDETFSSFSTITVPTHVSESHGHYNYFAHLRLESWHPMLTIPLVMCHYNSSHVSTTKVPFPA